MSGAYKGDRMLNMRTLKEHFVIGFDEAKNPILGDPQDGMGGSTVFAEGFKAGESNAMKRIQAIFWAPGLEPPILLGPWEAYHEWREKEKSGADAIPRPGPGGDSRQ